MFTNIEFMLSKYRMELIEKTTYADKNRILASTVASSIHARSNLQDISFRLKHFQLKTDIDKFMATSKHDLARKSSP